MPGVIEIISAIQQMKQGRNKAYLDAQQTLAGIAEKNPDFANYLSDQMYGTKPFKPTKIGETVTKTPQSKGMFGTETTILPGKEVRTGGYEVAAGIPQKMNLIKYIEKMEEGPQKEIFKQVILGIEPKGVTAIEQKKALLEETIAKSDTDPTKAPLLKMLGALIETSKDKPIEIGYGGNKMIKAYYDPQKQKWVHIGKPYPKHAPKEGEKYTQAQLEDDARAYADSLHGSLLTALREEDRMKWLKEYEKYKRDNAWKLTDPVKRAEMLKTLGDPLGLR